MAMLTKWAHVHLSGRILQRTGTANMRIDRITGQVRLHYPARHTTESNVLRMPDDIRIGQSRVPGEVPTDGCGLLMWGICIARVLIVPAGARA